MESSKNQPKAVAVRRGYVARLGFAVVEGGIVCGFLLFQGQPLGGLLKLSALRIASSADSSTGDSAAFSATGFSHDEALYLRLW